MDQARITDDFDEELPAPTKPTWIVNGASNKVNPPGNTGFVASTIAGSPNRYIVAGNLGAFTVKTPSTTGYVEIYVSGNISIGNGNKAEIVIPENVYATIYVGGNVDFGNGEVNSGVGSSKVATRLSIYGLSSAGTYSASGNGINILAFYGPTYDVLLNGTVETVGAVVAKSFSINGGGNGGFHYDEALGATGQISGWTVASYFDDARTDL